MAHCHPASPHVLGSAAAPSPERPLGRLAEQAQHPLVCALEVCPFCFFGPLIEDAELVAAASPTGFAPGSASGIGRLSDWVIG